jgi:hypothetical protein
MMVLSKIGLQHIWAHDTSGVFVSQQGSWCVLLLRSRQCLPVASIAKVGLVMLCLC